MAQTRRELVTSGVGILAVTTLVGCLGDDDHNDDQDDHEDNDDHDDHDHSHDNPEDGYFDEIGIYEFQLLDRAHDPHEEISYMHGDHWHGVGDFPTVPEGDNLSIGTVAYDEDGDEIELWNGNELRAAVVPGSDENVVSFDFHGDHIHIIGEEEGLTEIVFQVWQDDHADFQTEPLAVLVGDAHHDDHNHDDHDDHDHDDH